MRDISASMMRTVDEYLELRRVLFRAVAKFHRETNCGTFPGHWAECEQMAHALGFDDFEDWAAHEQLLADANALLDRKE